MNTLNINGAKIDVLQKLARRRKWGASHTSFDNLQKSFKKHDKKQIKEAAKELIREGLLLQKPTSYGLEVSLNPRRRYEITAIIKED